MFEVLVTLCLISDPSHCMVKTFDRLEGNSWQLPHNCTAAAVEQVMKWQSTNPGWKLSRWSCHPEREDL